MARNIELKARLADLDKTWLLVRELAGHAPEVIEQDDTFFACAVGRLKLRVFADGTGELIAYERADEAGPKCSEYIITPVTHPQNMRRALARALGVTGRVIKRRVLFLIGRTRVHLDRVQDLGDFLELEVVLEENESPDEGVAEAHNLLNRLQINAAQLVSGAYVDLLALRATD
jgi:predicted adenylyl cyclase CyaB